MTSRLANSYTLIDVNLDLWKGRIKTKYREQCSVNLIEKEMHFYGKGGEGV